MQTQSLQRENESPAALAPTLTGVTVIIPALNEEASLPLVLRDLPAVDRVIVVDNGSRDETASVIQREFGNDVQSIFTGRNLGYGKAANLGLKRVETEFGLLLNPDIRLHPGAVSHLVSAAETYSNAGLLSPALWNPDGRLQFGHRQFGSPFLAGVGKVGSAAPEGDCCTAYLSGAALFFSMDFLRDLGGFDE